MVLWQRPDTPLLSCFLVSTRSLVCVLCFMMELRIPALVSCSSFGSRPGFGHSCSIFVLAVGARSLEFARAMCSSVYMFCVLFCSRFVSGRVQLFVLLFCCTQLVLSAACYVFVLCCVACSFFFFFTGCMLLCLTWFVWRRGLWVISCVFV